jgi:hypothetical protein
MMFQPNLRLTAEESAEHGLNPLKPGANINPFSLELICSSIISWPDLIYLHGSHEMPPKNILLPKSANVIN